MRGFLLVTLLLFSHSAFARGWSCGLIYEWRIDEVTFPFLRYDREAQGEKTKDHGMENLIAENEVAQILSRFGFRVRQNPLTSKNQDIVDEYLWRQNAEGLNPNKNPDYMINRNIFDNYVPSAEAPYVIARGILNKVHSGQTHRVVVDMTQNPAYLEGRIQFADLIYALKKRSSEDLWEVIMVHGTRENPKVTTIWPEVIEHHSPYHP